MGKDSIEKLCYEAGKCQSCRLYNMHDGCCGRGEEACPHVNLACISCGDVRPLIAKGLCRSCYNKSRKVWCRNCMKMKLIHGQGLCSNCYHKLGVNPNHLKCRDCGKLKPHYAKGLCKSCYNKKITYEWRRAHPADFRLKMSKYQRNKRSKSRGGSPA